MPLEDGAFVFLRTPGPDETVLAAVVVSGVGRGLDSGGLG